MSEHQLRVDLERLRKEIEQLDNADQASRDRLDRLIEEIEARLRQSDEEDDDDESLQDRVQEAIVEFETEHPRATAILNDIMVTLSNMGI